MIAHSLIYLVSLALFSVTALLLAKSSHRFFHFVPPIVLLYISVMLLASNDVFASNEELTHSYKTLSSNLLPAMIFLMLLPHQPKQFFRLGGRMILSFFLTSISLFLAFILLFVLFHLNLDDITIFAPLAHAK